MAKKSKIARNKQRELVVAKYAQRRRELKAKSVDLSLSLEERKAAMSALHALPRDASPTRLRNRDAVDGRPRGFIGKAGVSRVRFRKMALSGLMPGISKSSW